ncbi:MAG: hypothetical protein ACYTXI_26170 [Nostoc sp.]
MTCTNAIATIQNTPLEESMTALAGVVRQGKARYIGFSEWKKFLPKS